MEDFITVVDSDIIEDVTGAVWDEVQDDDLEILAVTIVYE